MGPGKVCSDIGIEQETPLSSSQSDASSNARDGFIHFLSWACSAVAGVVLIFDLLTISLNRGFSPLEHTISEFVLMDYGWIERTGLFLLGATLLALGIVWFRCLGDKTDRLFHLAGLILVLLGLCILLIAAFNAEASKSGHTLHGTIHRVAAGIIAFVFPFFYLIAAWSLRNKRSLRLLALYSAFTGLIGLLNVGWAAFALASDQLPGLSERTLTLINLIWLAIAGFQITRLAAGDTSACSTAPPRVNKLKQIKIKVAQKINTNFGMRNS
jgi:uncharacterized membrane protein